jgi:hypothetical protein
MYKNTCWIFLEAVKLLVNSFENLDRKYRNINILSLNSRLQQINKIEKTNFKLAKEAFIFVLDYI